MLNKKRLDVMLFERGLTQSREKARTVIMAGNVYVDNQKADSLELCLRMMSKLRLEARE